MPNEHKSASTLLKDVILEHLGATGEYLQKIKLGRGAVGKIALVSIASVAAIAAVSLKLSTTASLLVAIAVLGIICLASLACIIFVLIRQPEMAVLEGAELVLYKQMTLGTKEQPALTGLTVPVPEHALTESIHKTEDKSGGAA